ncbi:hypothetical protein [Aurantiacibacter gangjinensis]|uniref:Uncharacterized protein n=1 Tax=Aurantiacibacter gangjinensis TaxID=502682 RepID=A0A0G9MRB9_9SPHN|nr:hypothetical protein [Aurantiacibacter gangjinensis]APE27903.1 peptidase M1, membrane alanine aminopeptidase [Aurantiacibacter gangjinensis]KLE31863.1 hypothetical protein AAW01_10345 [Aurantiacibacter gangjinensis]
MKSLFGALALVTLAACSATQTDTPRLAPQPGETANIYNLEVDVTPASKHIAVRGTIEIVADAPAAEAAFMLNDGVLIERFEPNVPASIEQESGIMLGTYEMPNTQRITLRFVEPLEAGQRVSIDVVYAGYIRDESIEWGRGLISEDWVELSLGTLWYPFWRDESELRSRIAVRVPDDFRVIGPGQVERDGEGRWIVDPGKPILGRITFAASPAYTVTSRQVTDAMRADLYTLGDEPRAGALLDRASDTYRYYTALLGEPRVSPSTLTMLHANEEVGVTRPQMAYATGGDYFTIGTGSAEEQAFLIAHEVAHFWWISGAAGTPDEFMTESIAEFVALRYGQTVWGDDWLTAKLDRASRISESIDGSILDEGDFEGRETLLYFRGPLVLWALQRRIGTEAMDALLIEAHAEDVSELATFMATLSAREGSEVASWFERQL